MNAYPNQIYVFFVQKYFDNINLSIWTMIRLCFFLCSLTITFANVYATINLVQDLSCTSGSSLTLQLNSYDYVYSSSCLPHDTNFDIDFPISFYYLSCNENYAGVECPSKLCFRNQDLKVRTWNISGCQDREYQTTCTYCPSSIQCQHCAYTSLNNEGKTSTLCLDNACEYLKAYANISSCIRDFFGYFDEKQCCTSYDWINTSGDTGICTTGTPLDNPIIQKILKDNTQNMFLFNIVLAMVSLSLNFF